MSISRQIDAYIAARGGHHSGTLRYEQLNAIERQYTSPGTSVETGCGASTILFSRLSQRHIVFCLDDRTNDNSSVSFVTRAPLFDASRVEFIFGPTQRTLREFPFEQELSAALIDGPHAYPFPEIEYYTLYPRLRTGALLALDDVHIPTLFHLYRFLREERMFAFVEKAGNLAIFRRTPEPTFNPLGDGWETQAFNRQRFPMVGRDEAIARYFPSWLTQLAPRSLRAAIKAYLFNSHS